MANDLILGLDFGTSSVKAIFIDDAGEILKRVEIKISTASTSVLHAEQNAEDYLEAVVEISKNNSDLISKVISIGLS
ncbi:MAG: FGGY family carbohydrate kinase, partial [Actinobacteria bacterium]|nr:FGGY family carbohydrate kinase [Actinomycetota bacterium]